MALLDFVLEDTLHSGNAELLLPHIPPCLDCLKKKNAVNYYTVSTTGKHLKLSARHLPSFVCLFFSPGIFSPSELIISHQSPCEIPIHTLAVPRKHSVVPAFQGIPSL